MSVAPAVDPEFKALLPELTPDQRAGLEKSILSEGVLSALVVWDEEGILLDGHNRLEIALREGIPFPTRTVKLASREAAVEWIFAHQRDRRNLTPDQLALVMGRHYNRTKQRQGGQVAGACSGKANTVERTSERLAEAYGVHPTTIIGHGKFAAAVETLRAVDPDIEQKVVTGKGPTRKAVVAAAEAAPEDARAILAGETKPAHRDQRRRDPKETLADKRGFKTYSRRPDAERAEAAVISLETIVESLGEIHPERLNGERFALAGRLGKAVRALGRIRKGWERKAA